MNLTRSQYDSIFNLPRASFSHVLKYDVKANRGRNSILTENDLKICKFIINEQLRSSKMLC